ncbi:MAG: response regulator [Candidatus Omnitrophota bacterium]|nr:response regulator [Candidatus Omnitrophota bacterium]
MKKVLVIDDEKEFCSFLKENLELLGRYRVFTATNGKEGLQSAKTERPDLILLDIMMPHMNGLEVLKRLKEDEKTISIPVIMLTALEDDESRSKTSYLYCEDYIVKPIKLSVLIPKMDEMLGKGSGGAF